MNSQAGTGSSAKPKAPGTDRRLDKLSLRALECIGAHALLHDLNEASLEPHAWCAGCKRMHYRCSQKPGCVYEEVLLPHGTAQLLAVLSCDGVTAELEVDRL